MGIDVNFQAAWAIEAFEASWTNMLLAVVGSREFIIIAITDVARVGSSYSRRSEGRKR